MKYLMVLFLTLTVINPALAKESRQQKQARLDGGL